LEAGLEAFRQAGQVEVRGAEERVTRPHAVEVGTPPFFPPSGPATGSFNGLHPESKFLAAAATP
jgi:hypothetical protein